MGRPHQRRWPGRTCELTSGDRGDKEGPAGGNIWTECPTVSLDLTSTARGRSNLSHLRNRNQTGTTGRGAGWCELGMGARDEAEEGHWGQVVWGLAGCREKVNWCHCGEHTGISLHLESLGDPMPTPTLPLREKPWCPFSLRSIPDFC